MHSKKDFKNIHLVRLILANRYNYPCFANYFTQMTPKDDLESRSMKIWSR
jgi:hypothetical protein